MAVSASVEASRFLYLDPATKTADDPREIISDLLREITALREREAKAQKRASKAESKAEFLLQRLAELLYNKHTVTQRRFQDIHLRIREMDRP